MKRCKKYISILCILNLFICLCGCGYNYPKPKHNDCELWDNELEGANPEFVEDYIYMWDLLENEYPLLSAAEQITGINAENIKKTYYKRITTVNNPQDFLDYVIDPCLKQFNYTGHLCAYDKFKYKQDYSFYRKNSDIIKEYPYVEISYKQITKPQSKIFYEDVIKEVDDSISKDPQCNENDEFNIHNNLSYKYYPDISVAYVNIRKMSTYNSLDNIEFNSLKYFFSKIEKDGYKNCIIDVRKNGGGNCLYWIDGIVSPNLSQNSYLNQIGLIKGEICKKYLSLTDCKIKPISELDTNDLPNLNPEDLNENLYYWSDKCKIPRSEKPLFTGKFWLLVSDFCYSSCETFAIYCKDTGFATLVGQTTGGDGVGVDPITFSLPNTGICMQFSSSLGLNPDGSGSEEFGTTPDIEIKDGEDALDKCLATIEGNKKDPN